MSGTLRLLLAAGCLALGPAPAQAVERGPGAPAPEKATDASQAYRSVTPRMTKKEVHKMLGNPSQSTDTLWIYAYADGTTVEITFSEQRRVTQVVSYKRRPKK